MSPTICVRCDQPAVDSLNLCPGCLAREIDDRGRYVRKDPA